MHPEILSLSLLVDAYQHASTIHTTLHHPTRASRHFRLSMDDLKIMVYESIQQEEEQGRDGTLVVHRRCVFTTMELTWTITALLHFHCTVLYCTAHQSTTHHITSHHPYRISSHHTSHHITSNDITPNHISHQLTASHIKTI